MLAFRSIISIAMLLTPHNRAAVVATRIVSLAERAPLVPAMYPKVTYYHYNNGTDLVSFKTTDSTSPGDLSILGPLIDPNIVVSAFQTTAKITEIVCNKAGATTCVVTALAACIGIYFTLYKMQGRELTDYIYHVDYPPVPGCGSRCRLELEAPEGGWRLIGNATVNGIFHTLHYKREGSYNGLRSIQYGSEEEFAKRAEDNYGGVVVDYNWLSLSEQAYDSFDSYSSEISDFADDIVDVLIDDNSIQACADFEDSDGLLDGGLVSIGWNNQPFEFQDGQEEALLDECANI